MVSIQIDGSRLIEDKSQPDRGANVLVSIVHTRDYWMQFAIKVEAFPNIRYYRGGFGPQFKVPIYAGYYDPLIELSAGIEVGVIYRFVTKSFDKHWMRGYYTYALNGDILFYVPGLAQGRTPIIFTYNLQRRTDFEMYNEPIKFVGSVFIGIGYIF